MGESEILKIILQGGVAPLLLIIVWTGAKGYWVFGREMRQCQQDRDEWKELALNGTSLARRSIELAHKGSDETKAI